jgi:hypothetical protein
MTRRIVQWTTGNVGRRGSVAVLDDPDLTAPRRLRAGPDVGSAREDGDGGGAGCAVDLGEADPRLAGDLAVAGLAP